MVGDAGSKPVSPASTGELVQQQKDKIARNTSRIFVVLMLLQWAGAILVAAILSPRTWMGTSSCLSALRQVVGRMASRNWRSPPVEFYTTVWKAPILGVGRVF